MFVSFTVPNVTLGVKPALTSGWFITFTSTFWWSSLIILLVVPLETAKEQRPLDVVRTTHINSVLIKSLARANIYSQFLYIFSRSASGLPLLTPSKPGLLITLKPCWASFCRSGFSVVCPGSPPRKTFCELGQKILGSCRKSHRKCRQSRSFLFWARSDFSTLSGSVWLLLAGPPRVVLSDVFKSKRALGWAFFCH